MLKGHLFHVILKTYFFLDFLAALTFDQAPVTSYLDFWNCLLAGFSAYSLSSFNGPEHT